MEENDNHKESQNIPGRVKPEPQENQADPKHKPSIPETNVLENINTLKTIHNLPTDVLAEVFNNLTHTQKLISRLVCTEWNNQISLMLSKASYFSLTSVESHETLLESDVQWTKFRISDSGYTLTKNVKNSVTTLQLDISGLGRSEYVRFLTGFPHLTSLDVQIGEDKSDKSKQDYSVRGQTQARLLNEQFRKRAGKLKILSVTCPFRKYGCLKNFLEAFDDETMSLTELNITEQQSQPESRYGGIYDYNYDPITRVDDKRSPMLQIYSTISKSKQTLIALDLNFCSKYMANELFTDFISKLTSLEPH